MSTGVTLEHEAAAVGLHGDALAVARAGQKFRVDANARKEILEQHGDFPLEHEGAAAWLITSEDIIRANFCTMRIETTLNHNIAGWKLTAPALSRIMGANRTLSAIAKATLPGWNPTTLAAWRVDNAWPPRSRPHCRSRICQQRRD